MLLAASGAITAVPLIWFAARVRRRWLSTIGLLPHLNPTLQFLIAVFAFGERFTAGHAVAFGCIWASRWFSTPRGRSRRRAGPVEARVAD